MMDGTQTVPDNDTDLIARIADEWRRACPEYDVDMIALACRVILAGRRLEQSATRATPHFDLDYSAIDVLATLMRRGEPYSITPSELLEEVLLTSGAMTSCLGRLEKRGFIRRCTHAHDARIKTVVLTGTGLDTIRIAYAARVEALSKDLSDLTKDEQHQLSALLQRLLSQMETRS